jgi:hypothetical protein
LFAYTIGRGESNDSKYKTLDGILCEVYIKIRRVVLRNGIDRKQAFRINLFFAKEERKTG